MLLCFILRVEESKRISLLRIRRMRWLQAMHEFKKHDISYKGLSMENM